MTKKVRALWKRMSFWLKLKLTLGSLGIGSEAALFMADSHHAWKIVALGATVLSIFIANFIEDKNNNGIADIFE